MDLTTFLSIDTETTGLSFEDDRVIEFGASLFIKGACVHSESFYINAAIPNGAFQINQITPSQIAGGLDPWFAFTTISRLLSKPPNRIVVYNAPFDLGFLACEFKRWGVPFDYRKLQILDPLIMWRKLKPFVKGNLPYVCSALNIPFTETHSACADSEAAGHVYVRLRSMYGQLRAPYLNGTQAKWHEAWTVQIIPYLRERYPDYIVPEPWPTRRDWMCSQSDAQSSLF